MILQQAGLRLSTRFEHGWLQQKIFGHQINQSGQLNLEIRRSVAIEICLHQRMPFSRNFFVPNLSDIIECGVGNEVEYLIARRVRVGVEPADLDPVDTGLKVGDDVAVTCASTGVGGVGP